MEWLGGNSGAPGACQRCNSAFFGHQWSQSFCDSNQSKTHKILLLFYLRLYFSFLCVYCVAGSRVERRFRGWGQRGRIAWELNSGPLKDREDSKHAGISLAPQKAFQCVPLFPKNQDQSTVLYDLWRDVAHEKRWEAGHDGICQLL